MRKYLHDIWRLLRFIAVRFKQERCGQAAASLTFATLLALVPMITIALTIFGAFPVFEEFSTEIKKYLLNNLVPDKAGAIISRYFTQFAESAARLKTVGIIFLAVTAMSMMMTIDKTFNVIWRVTRHRSLLKQLVVYAAVLTCTPLLVGASLSLTSWLVGMSLGFSKHIPVLGIFALKILPTLFTSIAFFLLFKLVPNRYVPTPHAIIAALVSALLFEAMNRGFGHYVSNFPTYKLVYGAFSSVPIFLMWIYLSWLIILLGAVVAASLSHWRMQNAENQPPIKELLLALQMLRALWRGHQNGRVTTFPELSRQLRVGYDTLEHLLLSLKKAKLVSKAKGRGWVMAQGAEDIKVVELLRLFALDASALEGQYDDPLQKWLVSAVEKMEQNADLTLQELFSVSP